MTRMLLIILGSAAVIVGMLGFRGQISKNRPWHVFWDMKYQPKYTAQARSAFFGDGRTMRLPVTGTVAFTTPGYFTDAGQLTEPNADVLQQDSIYFKGVNSPTEVEIEIEKPGPDGKPVKEKIMTTNWIERIPEKAVKQAGGWKSLLERGKQRYTIYCSVCHGTSGSGGQGDAAHGIVGRYGMVGIASYHQDRLREMADGEIFNTITHGKNSMSAYGHQVQVQDRWAIVAYVRALQRSQMAPIELVPLPERERLGVK